MRNNVLRTVIILISAAVTVLQHTEFIKSIPSIVRVSILIPPWKPI